MGLEYEVVGAVAPQMSSSRHCSNAFLVSCPEKIAPMLVSTNDRDVKMGCAMILPNTSPLGANSRIFAFGSIHYDSLQSNSSSVVVGSWGHFGQSYEMNYRHFGAANVPMQ